MFWSIILTCGIGCLLSVLWHFYVCFSMGVLEDRVIDIRQIINLRKHKVFSIKLMYWFMFMCLVSILIRIYVIY